MRGRPMVWIVTWVVVVAVVGSFASRLAGVLRGGTDPIPGSSSEHVTHEMERAFGEGALYQYLVVLSAPPGFAPGDDRLAQAGTRLAQSISGLDLVRSVDTPWTSLRPELLSDDGRTALVVVTPRVNAYLEAERFGAALRGAITRAQVPQDIDMKVRDAYDRARCPSKRGCCHPRSSLTPPCGTTAVGSSGTTHEAGQACVMRGRNKG